MSNKKSITIIVGGPATGKTHLAQALARDKECVWLFNSNLKSPFVFSEVTNDTELIVIEECKNIEQIKYLITAEKIVINRKYKKCYELLMPDLIITSNDVRLIDSERTGINIIHLIKK